MKVPAPTVRALRRRLLAWFAAEQRDLPWRRTRDPYAIWISEALLQQTRVETVRERWGRFLARFPDVRALAAADVEEVVAEWSGLGYYRRARSLHAAAQTVVERHAGEFPRSRAEAEALPGVGRYTAGAVLSIAHGLREPLVDGNVARVLARLFAREGDEWDVAEQLVPAEAPGDWNQALMELGALVCTPRAPRCDACPVATLCRARRDGRVDELPAPRARRAPLDVALEVLVVRRDDGVLLVRRPAGGRMARMWELPTREAHEPTHLWPAEFGHGEPLSLRAAEALGELRHGITHHRIRAAVHAGQLSGPPPSDDDVRFVPSSELDALGVTGMTRKIARAFVKG